MIKYTLKMMKTFYIIWVNRERGGKNNSRIRVIKDESGAALTNEIAVIKR